MKVLPIYEEQMEILESLPEESMARITLAMFAYARDKELPEMNVWEKAVFDSFKLSMDKSKARSEAGAKGGSKPKQTVSKDEANASKPQANESKDQANVKQTEANAKQTQANKKQEIKNKKQEVKNIYIPYAEIIDHLNMRAGTQYMSSSRRTQELIRARFNDGFTLEDFKTVIDKKCVDWMNTEMEKFLRPETLFGTKFEGYLNAQVQQKQDFLNTSVDYSKFAFRKGVPT